MYTLPITSAAPAQHDLQAPLLVSANLKKLNQTMDLIIKLEAFVQSDVLNTDAIMLLAELEDSSPHTIGRLAGTLGLSSSKMTRLVVRLLEKKLIVEHPSRSDTRKCDIRITVRGKNVLFEAGQEFGKEALRNTLDTRAALLHAKQDASLQCGKGLSFTDIVILSALCLSRSGLSVSQLNALTHFAQSRVSMSLRTLRKKGLVRSTIVSHDRRQHIYQLTAQGQASIDTSALFKRKHP